MSVIKHVTQLQHNNEQMLDIPVHIRKISWFSYPSWKHIRVTLSWYKTLDGTESALSQASQQTAQRLHESSVNPKCTTLESLTLRDLQGMQNDSLALRSQAITSCCDSLAEQLATINTGISIDWAFDILFCKQASVSADLLATFCDCVTWCYQWTRWQEVQCRLPWILHSH